jgi:hypothetical protein
LAVLLGAATWHGGVDKTRLLKLVASIPDRWCRAPKNPVFVGLHVAQSRMSQMNIEEVPGTTTPWPEAAVPLGKDDRPPADEDAFDRGPFPAFLVARPTEPIWPRVFPGL